MFINGKMTGVVIAVFELLEKRLSYTGAFSLPESFRQKNHRSGGAAGLRQDFTGQFNSVALVVVQSEVLPHRQELHVKW